MQAYISYSYDYIVRQNPKYPTIKIHLPETSYWLLIVYEMIILRAWPQLVKKNIFNNNRLKTTEDKVIERQNMMLI